MVNLFFNLQSRASENSATLLLGGERYLRVKLHGIRLAAAGRRVRRSPG